METFVRIHACLGCDLSLWDSYDHCRAVSEVGNQISSPEEQVSIGGLTRAYKMVGDYQSAKKIAWTLPLSRPESSRNLLFLQCLLSLETMVCPFKLDVQGQLDSF